MKQLIVADVRRMCGISHSALAERAKKAGVHSFQSGNKWYYTYEAAMKIINQHKKVNPERVDEVVLKMRELAALFYTDMMIDFKKQSNVIPILKKHLNAAYQEITEQYDIFPSNMNG